MITEVKNNYKSILKHFDFDESISSVDYKKQKLIERAKNGEPKPHWKTKEGKSLRSYTYESSSSYCVKFDKLIRKLAPSWFYRRKFLFGTVGVRCKDRSGSRYKEKFKMENNMITCKEVVDRFVSVSTQNPAYKAHATRMLNSYVTQQCSITGAKPTQIIAGVKAAITKRKRCL